MKLIDTKRLIRFSYVFIDGLFACLAIYLACYIRQEIQPLPNSFQAVLRGEINPYRQVFLFWVIVTVLVNKSRSLYQTNREIFESREIWEVMKSVALSALLTIVVIYLAKVEGFPRSIFILMVVLTTIFFSLWRVGKRLFVEYLVVEGYNNFNSLIIGAGKVGLALAAEIKKRPGMGIRIVGFLDDFKTSDPGQGVKILGKIADFSSVARKEFVNKLFITIHHDSQVFLDILEQAREQGIAVRVVPQGFEHSEGEFLSYHIGLIPILGYCDVQYSQKQVGKRLFDFTMSLLALTVCLPLFLIIALIIKWDSPGPVFYVSRRYGRRGNIFPMLKFRSMGVDAHAKLDSLRAKNEVDGPIFKIKKDPRVTRVGKILRKYSLDELPQIINVLKGEMSFVGPRPFPIEQIEKEDLKQLKRLEVRPGITGLWQIRGRSDISFSRLVKWDIWYINNWSFWLDINILLQTIPVVIKGSGAY